MNARDHAWTVQITTSASSTPNDVCTPANASVLNLQTADARVFANFHAKIAAAPSQRRDELMRFAVAAQRIVESDQVGFGRQVGPAAPHLLSVENLVGKAEAVIKREQLFPLRPGWRVEQIQAADVLEAVAVLFQVYGQLPVEL